MGTNPPLPNTAKQSEDRPVPLLRTRVESLKADRDLIAQGWVRRHLVDPARARESIELYTSMGYEVKAQEPAPEDFGSRCGQCASIICHSHVLIYTRRK